MIQNIRCSWMFGSVTQWLWISGNLHWLTKYTGVLKLEPLGNSTTEAVVIVNPAGGLLSKGGPNKGASFCDSRE